MPCLAGPPSRYAVVLTDALLFQRGISEQARLLVGFALGHPDHAPSNSLLKLYLPLNDGAIALARREIARARLAYVDRPREKTPGTQRFARAVRLTRFASHVDPNQPGARFIVFPASLTQRLRGAGGPAACRLAIFYHREQRMRGAIQIPDSVAAWRFDWTVRKVQLARRRLERAGVVERVSAPTSTAPAVFVMPGAHPTAVPRPEELDEARTRYLLPIQVANVSTTTYASVGERTLLEALLALAPPGDVSDLLGPAPIIARDAIQRLGYLIEQLPRALGTGLSRGQHRIEKGSAPDGAEVSTGWERETALPNNLESPSSLPCSKAQAEPEDARTVAAIPRAGSADGFSAREEHPEGGDEGDTPFGATAEELASKEGRFERREWGEAWSNLHTRATPQTHERLARFLEALEAAYDHTEAREEFRGAVLPLKGNGADVLDYFKRKYPHRDPGQQAEPGLADDLAAELSGLYEGTDF